MATSLDKKIQFYRTRVQRQYDLNESILPYLTKQLQDNLQIYNNRPSNVPNNYNFDEINVNQTKPPFQFHHLISYLNGNPYSTELAQQDANKSFENYYLGLILTDEAYNASHLRKRIIGNNHLQYLADESNDYYAVYQNPKKSKLLYIALRGTRLPTLKDVKHPTELGSRWNDIQSDMNIALGGNEDLILLKTDDEFEKLMKKYPNKQFVLYGHSLGSSRTYLLTKKYENRIKKAIGFNMGVSNLGFNPEYLKKFHHFHIKGDPISQSSKLAMKQNRTELIKRGRHDKKIDFLGHTDAHKISGFHGLHQFLHSSVSKTVDSRANELFSEDD